MMLDYAYWITQGLLAAALIGAVCRAYRGPSVLDRVISLDVILIVVASVMLTDMAYNRHQDHIIFVVVTAVIGFLGAVALARYVVVRTPRGSPAQGGASGGDPGVPADTTPPDIQDENRLHEEATEQHTVEVPGARSYPRPAPDGSEEDEPEEDETTAWFTHLTRSGYRPRARGDDQSQDESLRQDDGTGSEGDR
ncbi:monovalent cation/H+ antiporter complex subunit F [Nesterenkonia pannonica]|uniref:monovalent cation/H+ antiporter complex subunit F n=1 Tax=Nesterenkonia pannonica TaxID=1548602 RepID=UPI002164BC47|nr:monovalent cation/H+ antiporter complex subunit F [Nesterenkonia pannonica]